MYPDFLYTKRTHIVQKQKRGVKITALSQRKYAYNGHKKGKVDVSSVVSKIPK